MITLPYAFRDEYIGMVQVAQFKRAALTACSCEKLLIMTRHPVIVFSFCSAKGASSDSSISCSHSVGCTWTQVRMMPLRDAFSGHHQAVQNAQFWDNGSENSRSTHGSQTAVAKRILRIKIMPTELHDVHQCGLPAPLGVGSSVSS